MASFPSFFITNKFPSRPKLRALLSGPLTGLSFLVYSIFVLLCAAIFIFLVTLNAQYLTTVPARGGNLTEGVIGAPHFINPLLATTDTDKRLVALVYGSIQQFIASYTVSPDGKIYTVVLQPNILFSDKKPLTSDDVAFTVQKMQDNMVSTNSTYWENISVDNPDPQTVVFTLPAADTGFLSHLSFGILPKHIWETISDDAFESAKQNLQPVGAGPFKVSSIGYTGNIPTDVVLSRNTLVQGSPALLHTLTINSYDNQAELVSALNAGDVDFSYAVSPNTITANSIDSSLHVTPITTDATVSIYRSSNDSVLSNPSTVNTISQIIDKNAIIATVLNGYGTPAGGLSNTSASTISSTSKKIPGFSIAVENDPSLLLTAQTLAQQLQIQGVTIAIKAFDPGIFQKNATAGTFFLLLARSNDVTIPSQYAVVLPLYTQTQPYVFNTTTHTIPPDTIASPIMEYDSVTSWYSHTDRLWKWFIHNK